MPKPMPPAAPSPAPAVPKPASPAAPATPPAPAPTPGAPAAAPPPPVAKPPARPPTKTSNPDTNDLLTRFAGRAEQVEDVEPAMPAIRIAARDLIEIARYLRDDRGFDHLSSVTAIDWKDRFEVVYPLWSYGKNRPICLRVSLPRENPSVPSLVGLWSGANWLEREEYDLMGIKFEGHPDLRRMFLPEGWQGHPLRKDYDLKHEQYVGMDSQGNDVVYQEPREDAW